MADRAVAAGLQPADETARWDGLGSPPPHGGGGGGHNVAAGLQPAILPKKAEMRIAAG